MAWIELTEARVKGSAGLTGPELSAARTAALPEGATDTLADVLSRVTREVRGYVAGCAQNTLGEGATIPDELLSAALARLVFELAVRLPGKVLLSDQRDKANDSAMRMLRDAAACTIRIAQPENATVENVAAPTPRINERERSFRASDQAGL